MTSPIYLKVLRSVDEMFLWKRIGKIEPDQRKGFELTAKSSPHNDLLIHKRDYIQNN